MVMARIDMAEMPMSTASVAVLKVMMKKLLSKEKRERLVCLCLCAVVDWIDSKVVRLLTQPDHAKEPMHVVPVSLWLVPWLSYLFLGGGFVSFRCCLVCTRAALVSTSETARLTVERKKTRSKRRRQLLP